MAEKQKEQVFSTLSTFAVLLIIFIHSFPSLDASNQNAAARALVQARVFTGELPVYLFVMISGCLFALTTPAERKINYLSFIGKKAKRLLLPYAALSAVAYPVKCALSRFAYRPVDFSLATFAKSLIYPSTNTIFFFWFLPALFGAFLFAPLLITILRSPRKSILIPAATTLLAALYLFNPADNILLFGFGKTCGFLFFFWAGMIYHSIKDARIPARSALAALAFVTLIALKTFLGESYIKQLISILLFAFATHQLAAVYVGNNLKIFNFMDGYSYPIYLLSWFPIVFIRILLAQKLGANFLLTVASLYLGGLFASLAAAKIIVKYAPRAKSLIGM